MRAARAILFGLDRRLIVGAVRVVIADEAPKIIMLDGSRIWRCPCRPVGTPRPCSPTAKERPYRADEGLLEVAIASRNGEDAS